MIQLSPSSINTFMRCQLQYEFRYVRGIKIPPNSALTIGRAFHRALEENFKQKIETFEDLKTEDVLDIYATAFESYSQEVEEWDEDKGKAKDSGAKLTEIYMEQKAKEIMPDTVEDEIKIQIDSELTIVGYRDLTTVDGKVIDFKTTNRTPKEISFDYKLQLDIYSLTDDASKAEIHYAVKKKQPEIVVLKHDISKSTVVIELAKKIKEQIKTGVFVPTGLSHSWACDYCGYRDRGLCTYKK